MIRVVLAIETLAEIRALRTHLEALAVLLSTITSLTVASLRVNLLSTRTFQHFVGLQKNITAIWD